MGINNGTAHSAICGTVFDLSRASEHGNRSGLYDIQIITLDPELVNPVRNLKGQRDFIRLHQFNLCKPPLERIGAEMRPDFPRYFPPNLIVSLLHWCLLFTLPVARRNTFHLFRPEDRKKKSTPFPDHLRQNDSKPFLSSDLQR